MAASFARARRRFLKSITLVMGQKQQLLWDLPPWRPSPSTGPSTIPRPSLRAAHPGALRPARPRRLVGKPTRQLSLGERMKASCGALLHRPRVLFLDEPTIGLDVTMQATVASS